NNHDDQTFEEGVINGADDHAKDYDPDAEDRGTPSVGAKDGNIGGAERPTTRERIGRCVVPGSGRRLDKCHKVLVVRYDIPGTNLKAGDMVLH
ncbi:unnamed protein product, partial [Amoebophrya sp. A25]